MGTNMRSNYHGRNWIVIPRTLLLVGMVVGVALAIGCGRTEMETLAHVTGTGTT